MIQFIKEDDGIHITESFSDEEFFNLLKNTICGDGDYELLEVAIIHFLTEGANEEDTTEQLEKITSFIEQINLQHYSKASIINKLAIIYGHSALLPFYMVKQDQIPKTYSFYNQLVQTVQELLPMNWKEITYINTENIQFQRHFNAQNREEWTNNITNTIKYPGLLFPSIDRLINEFPQIVIEIYNSPKIYQYYQYEEHQQLAVSSLTMLIFSRSNNLVDFQQKMLIQDLKFVYDQQIFREANQNKIQIFVSSIFTAINCASEPEKALVCTWIRDFLPLNVKMDVTILQKLLEIIQYDVATSVQIFLQYILENVQKDSSQFKYFDDVLKFIGELVPKQQSDIYRLQLNQVHDYMLNMIRPYVIEQFEQLFNVQQFTTNQVKLCNLQNINVFQLIFIDFALIFRPAIITIDELSLQNTMRNLLPEIQAENDSVTSSIWNIVFLFVYAKNLKNLANLQCILEQIQQSGNQCINIILLILHISIQFQQYIICQGHKCIYNEEQSKTCLGKIINELEERQISNSLFKGVQTFYYHFLANQAQNLQKFDANNISVEEIQRNLLKSQEYVIQELISQQVTNGTVIVYVLEQSTYLNEDLIEQFVAYLFSQIFTEKMTYQSYYEILNVFYNSYDVSPTLSTKINVHLKQLNNTNQTNIIKYIGILYLLQEYGYTEQSYTITKLQAILESQECNDVIHQSIQNEIYASYFHIYLLKIVLSLENQVYNKYKNFINKVCKYIFQYAYDVRNDASQFNVYKQINIELSTAHIRQMPGLAIFLNNVSKNLNDLLNDDVNQHLKTVYLTLVQIQQFENQRISTKDFNKVCDYVLKIIDGKRIPVDICECIGIYFRNYLLHECNISQINKSQSIIKILSFLMQIFAISNANTVLQTIYLQLYNFDALNIILNKQNCSYTIQNGMFVQLKEDANFLEKLNSKQIVCEIIESCLKIHDFNKSKPEQQNYEILSSYIQEGIENGIYDSIDSSLIQRFQQCVQSEMSNDYESDDNYD